MGRRTSSSRNLLGRAPLRIVLPLLANHARHDLHIFGGGRRYYIAVAGPRLTLGYLINIPELWRGSWGWRIDLIDAPVASAPVQAAAATSSTTVPDAQSAPAQTANASSTPAVDAESDDTQAASKSTLANDTQDDDAQAASASPTVGTDSENETAPVTATSSASAQLAHEDAPKDTRNDTAQPMVTSSVPATGPQIDASKLSPKPAWQTPGSAISMTDIKTPSKEMDWKMQFPTLGAGVALKQEEEDFIGEPKSASPENQSAHTVEQRPTRANDHEPEAMEPVERLESSHVEDQPAGQAEQGEEHSSTAASDSERTTEDAPRELQSLLQTEADNPAGQTEIASSPPASDDEPEATEPPSFSGKGYVKVDSEEHQGSKLSKRAQRAEKKEEKRRR
ncbi:hypothetical protein CKM354_000763000 [Cercospora kikuchii]|uniref:Uncharacterized protein n=1 Tax=Cercospora kikuchii TaxID=84275 RepID=A0A9P3FHN2_9PEZI|nr:uncharacterized protein CKM354_000763000 [Cercospora kikuchii]GIZ44432.1 hypothetical protein CKM354_000763000 [Cercospora kikuchii]